MPEIEILQRLSDIAALHFSSADLVLTRDTVATDVEGWDSLAHIQFLMEIESAFKVRFKSSEASSFTNVGQLADRIATKLGN